MRFPAAVIAAAVLLSLSCSRGTTADSSAEAASGGREVEVLAAADAADGTVDKIVSKCAVCALGMDGSPDHVARHAGYEFHLCSANCKETFEHDPAKVIARLPAPRS